MKLFTKKTRDKNNNNASAGSIEQRLNDNIFKHKNGFDAQRNKLHARINGCCANKKYLTH